MFVVDELGGLDPCRGVVVDEVDVAGEEDAIDVTDPRPVNPRVWRLYVAK
jgi:hypothetical protein